jgi:hypothetical protein
MRTVQTCILRLLVDPAEPEPLRGALQPVPEGETQPFVGEQELLAVLYRLICTAGETGALDESTDEKD